MRLLLRAFFFLCFLVGGAAASFAQTANFTMSPSSGAGCAPLIVQFTSTSTGATSYYWSLGPGITVATNNSSPSATYTSPGTYPVTLHINSPTGPSITKTVTVYPPPVPSFTYSNSSGCAPLTVSFNGTAVPGVPGGVIYSWYYGDGNSGAGTASTHTYTTSGTFSVTLTATNSAGCTGSTTQTNIITVYPKPGGNFTASNTLLCSTPATVNFSNSATNGSGPYTVYWDFGDGTSPSTSNNPSHTYSSSGTYTVTLVTMDARGCKDTVVKTNYIKVHANNASFNGPTSACDSSNSSFSNTSSGVTGGTLWLWGDATSDTGRNVNHMYTDTGTYTIKMVTQVGPCSDTVTKTIVIHPKPVISVTNDVVCLPGTITFTASSTTPLSTYNWSWNSGGTATTNPATHYYAGYGTDSTLLIAGTTAGCSDTIKVGSVIQDWKPNVYFIDQGCVPLADIFNCDSTPCSLPCIVPCACLYPYKITSYTWWVDGTLQSNTTHQINPTFSTTGPHNVVLKTITANGCVRYDTFYVCVGMKVHPSFYAYPDTTVCVKTPVWFKNTTGDSAISYYWYYGSNELDTNTGDYNGYHRYQYPKDDTVMLVSTICGCSDTAIKPNYIHVLPSDAHFTDSVYCPPSKTVAFKNTSVGATTDYWDFGDGTTSTAANPPPHTYVNYGAYAVKHMTWSSTYGCRDTIVDTVHIIPRLIDFTADTTLCLGDTIKLYGTFSGLPIYHSAATNGYTWIVDGSGLTYDTSTVTHRRVLTTRGFHSVEWVVQSGEGGRCRDSVTKTNYVLISHPVAAFDASIKIGCTPLAVLFIDSTSYTSGTQAQTRQWIFGDGSSVTNGNLQSTHTYTTAGKYTVTLKVTDWIGCMDSLTKTDYIDARHPTANFGVNFNAGCTNFNFVFSDSSKGATGLFYKWSFGDGDTSTAKNPTHAYRSPGLYGVRLIVIDSSGCADTMTKSSYILITKPTARFTLSDTLTVCPPITVHFDASSSTNAYSYAWDFGNGSTAAFAKPSSLYMSPGVYDIMLIVSDVNGCPDTAKAKVRVLGYAGALTYSPLAGCVPLTVNFLASLSNVPKIVWDFSDGDTALATASSTTHTYRIPGAFVPKLVFYDSKGCSASSTGTDTIKVDAVEAGFKVYPPCEQRPVILTDTSHSYFSPLYSWRWEFGPGQTATGPTVTRVFPSAGQYPVTLIVSNTRGCWDTLSTNITIYPSPVITGFGDTTLCPPDAVPIYAIGGSTYTWSPGATLSCTNCTSPLASPVVPTAYVVSGTDSNGCINKDTVKIGIQAKTTFNVTSGGEICLGQHFQLLASGATVYHWTPAASLNFADTAAPIATPTVTTTYIATGKEGSCAVDTHMIKVIVNPVPTVDAGKDEQLIAGNSVQLQASAAGADHIEWKADPALSCTTCYAPYAAPKLTTTFYITAYTAKGCTATDSVTVHVLCDNSMLFIPNTFTPNGDGLNDYFFPRGKGIDIVSAFRVYSRWGELLFSREAMPVNDEFAGWNGTYKGQKLAPDVYVYIIEAKCDNGDPIKWKGDVTLMR